MDETKNFNSHAHVERDDRVRKMVVEFEISTHTLTWSVTWEDFDFTLNKLNFNSHAHVERDRGRNMKFPQRGKFQLTRSRGA